MTAKDTTESPAALVPSFAVAFLFQHCVDSADRLEALGSELSREFDRTREFSRYVSVASTIHLQLASIFSTYGFFDPKDLPPALHKLQDALKAALTAIEQVIERLAALEADAPEADFVAVFEDSAEQIRSSAATLHKVLEELGDTTQQLILDSGETRITMHAAHSNESKSPQAKPTRRPKTPK